MNWFHQIIGALVEAWGEVKVQKVRAVLSLVGVTAAVAAMSVVIALGDLIVQMNLEFSEMHSGRSITLHVTASKQSDKGDQASAIPLPGPPGLTGAASTPDSGGADADASDRSTVLGTKILNPMGDAMATVADRYKIPYWARKESGSATFEEVRQALQAGTFRGRRAVAPPFASTSNVQISAVDPTYSTIFRLDTIAGRWLAANDADQRLVPIVINSVLWDCLGRAPLNDPIVLTSIDPSRTKYRVVGVVKGTTWDSPAAYVDYTAWQYVKTAKAGATGEQQGDSSAGTEMLVWVGADQATQARKALPGALQAVLGSGWKASASGGESWDGGQSELSTMRTVIMVIGGIVIFLGALGLLNVAIVTVRQRIREIGIRRAMGASARRVFFAVFMESVVATFLAGVIGVGLAIIIHRVLPLEAMGLLLKDRPVFPMHAAVTGVSISTAIGALCGIIPAFAAVKVKPIDAIRY